MFEFQAMYLDLGAALVAYGLIFTVYQLRSPRWRIILFIRGWWQSNLFWFVSAIALALALAGVLLTAFPTPLPRLPLLCEVLAYLAFIASPAALLLLATSGKNLFNRKTAARLYRALLSAAATSDDAANSAVDVLCENIELICKHAQEPPVDARTFKFARATFNVFLSDDNTAAIFTTKRLDALQLVIESVKKYNLTQEEVRVGFSRLLYHLFYDSQSFLYKHLDAHGLALVANVYDSIFRSPTLLTNFDTFGYPSIDSWPTRTDILEVKVFVQALSRAVETYLTNGTVPPERLNTGLAHMSAMSDAICLRISMEQKGTAEYTLRSQWEALDVIMGFLRHGYIYLAPDIAAKDVAEREKHVDRATFYSNSTINAGVAKAIYKLFEQLSYIEKTAATHERYHAIVELFGAMTLRENPRAGYRKPFEDRMWQQIARNVLNGHYPAVLPIYLEFIGLCLISPRDQGEWLAGQCERMRRLLYVDLGPRLDQRATMINDEPMKSALLPQAMTYIDGKFFYTAGFGHSDRREIAPPDPSAKSALEGVDFESTEY